MSVELTPEQLRRVEEIERRVEENERRLRIEHFAPKRFAPRYFDRDGNPITFARWCGLLETPAYKIIKQEGIGEGIEVSTVWLGLDHNFTFSDTPQIFETMIFGPTDLSGEMERYSTELDALRGHRRIVQALVDGRNLFG